MNKKQLTTQINPLKLFGNDEGKNSTSFIALDEQLNAKVFTKQMPKEQFNHPREYYKEAIIQHRCRHPHIAQIQYAGETHDSIYYMLNLYEKGSINSLIKTNGLPPYLVIKYSLEFLSGLHFMHTQQILHFDIKPSNILLSEEGSAILADFGTSTYMNAVGFGKLNNLYIKHLAPEVIEGMLAEQFDGLGDVSIDIYQSGLTIYRLCLGNATFNTLLPPSDSLRDTLHLIKTEKFPNFDLLKPEFHDFKPIIAKCTAFNPEHRYLSVMDIIHDLSFLK